jgi:hypothetical protein
MNKESEIGDNTQSNKPEIHLALTAKQRDTLIAVLLAAPDNREICTETVASLLRSLLKEDYTSSVLS